MRHCDGSGAKKGHTLRPVTCNHLWWARAGAYAAGLFLVNRRTCSRLPSAPGKIIRKSPPRLQRTVMVNGRVESRKTLSGQGACGVDNRRPRIRLAGEGERPVCTVARRAISNVGGVGARARRNIPGANGRTCSVKCRSTFGDTALGASGSARQPPSTRPPYTPVNAALERLPTVVVARTKHATESLYSLLSARCNEVFQIETTLSE